MSTIPSTQAEFNKDWRTFHAAIGDRSHSQDQIAGGHKALTLRYLGLTGTKDQIEHCAMLLEIATSGAVARGWSLQR
jgi:hypothetical protein